MSESKKYELKMQGTSFKDIRTNDTQLAKIQILEAENAELKKQLSDYNQAMFEAGAHSGELWKKNSELNKQLAVKNLYAELGELIFKNRFYLTLDIRLNDYNDIEFLYSQIKDLEAGDGN